MERAPTDPRRYSSMVSTGQQIKRKGAAGNFPRLGPSRGTRKAARHREREAISGPLERIYGKLEADIHRIRQ